MKKFTTLIICALLVLIALLAARILIATAPEAERKRPPRQTLLVETLQTRIQNETVKIEVAGTVIPAQEIELRTPVNGKILWTSDQFIAGGRVKKGEVLVQLDTNNYTLAIENANAGLAQAQFEYEMELGRQDIAKREWALLKADDATEQERALALRIPHLKASKAALASAKARVRRAELDLGRTTLTAPFNALVRSRYTSVGTQANPQTLLARLAGTDVYHIEASIPMDRLKWISFPGSRATVHSASGGTYQGTVIQLTGSLETRGRMVRILIAVNDPWGAETPIEKPLLLGEYVETIVEGSTLENVTRIPRRALREGNVVWLDTDGKLDLQPVEVLFRESDSILVRGLPADSFLITTDIAAPVPGQPVNRGEKEQPAQPEGATHDA
tara:strand:+ start:978 stop:2141 length:1164 start_codon:yes stop_codon:yes gene_type:complete